MRDMDSSARPFDKSRRRSRWVAATALGLISSVFSTVVSQLFAARIGRDAAVDFSWALVFFGVLGRWTADRDRSLSCRSRCPGPSSPLRRNGWWCRATTVHAAATLLDRPPRPWLVCHHVPAALEMAPRACARCALRQKLDHRRDNCDPGAGHTRVVRRSRLQAAWIGRDRDADQAFIRHTRVHHAQGIDLAQIASERAKDPHLRSLMVASQVGENRFSKTGG